MKARLVEQVVQNPPEGMARWRNFRIEYDNGMEGLIWLPPHTDRSEIESVIGGPLAERGRTKRALRHELAAIAEEVKHWDGDTVLEQVKNAVCYS